jgi:hypothetical protein
MCFSFEASISAFVLGILGSVLIFRLGTVDDKIFGLFFGYVSLMQGIEGVLWKHQKCDDFHKNVTSLGMILNMSQPLFLLFASRLFYPSNKNITLLYAIALLYMSYEIYHFIQFQQTSHCTTPQKDDPHLIWSWLNMKDTYITWTVYLSTLFLMFTFGMKSINSGLFAGFGGLITALLSSMFYPGRSVGSIWCFFTAFIPVLYLMWNKALGIV